MLSVLKCEQGFYENSQLSCSSAGCVEIRIQMDEATMTSYCVPMVTYHGNTVTPVRKPPRKFNFIQHLITSELQRNGRVCRAAR